MHKIKTLIIDDEIHNRNIIRTLIGKKFDEVFEILEASGADMAYNIILEQKPQLLFLDVKMPVKSGFDLLRMFSEIPFEVIFVSAFNEYAVNAFDFNAIGYILKPIDLEKFEIAVSKALVKIKSSKSDATVLNFINSLEQENNTIEKIKVHHQDRVVFIKIKDILFFESHTDYIELEDCYGQRFYSTRDLKDFENLLENYASFIRISRSVIINANYISSYAKGEVFSIELINNKVYEVPRRKKAEVLERIDKIT